MQHPLMQTGKKRHLKNKYLLDPLLMNSLSTLLCTLFIFVLCRGAFIVSDRVWLDTGSVWLKVAPFGLRKLLNFIKEQYGNPPIIITENGVSEKGTVDLNDVQRSYFYEKYINQVLKGTRDFSF